MPIQIYRCPEHGEFELVLAFNDTVWSLVICPTCGTKSWWVPSAPNFIGGPTTGAKEEEG